MASIIYEAKFMCNHRRFTRYNDTNKELKQDGAGGNTLEITGIVERQRAFFMTDATKNIDFRRDALNKLLQAVKANERKILDALKADLNKADFEGYMTEVGLVREECRFAQNHLKKWTRAKKVHTPLSQFPARSFVISEPYGVSLIMSPWNYPFLLTLEPLIGAICAGNCAVVKPSAYSPATSQAIADLIAGVFPPEYITVIQGGRVENAALLEKKFDFIFFTGSIAVGQFVMEKASRYLTPVCLELGGKSPAIVDETADIALAATRIAWGKYLNAGQTCIAPDFVLVHESKKQELITELKRSISRFFPDGAMNDKDYVHIINDKQFDRLVSLMNREKAVIGGEYDRSRRIIAPAVLDDIRFDSPVMGEEIFGPLLPVISYKSLDETIAFLKGQNKPLALYLFTSDKTVQKKVLNSLSYGGGCINDTVVHSASTHMGFGGVGSSGMGAYHGKLSFDTFSHFKSIVSKKTWLDLPMRYHPYTARNFWLLRKFLK